MQTAVILIKCTMSMTETKDVRLCLLGRQNSTQRRKLHAMAMAMGRVKPDAALGELDDLRRIGAVVTVSGNGVKGNISKAGTKLLCVADVITQMDNSIGRKPFNSTYHSIHIAMGI